MRRLGFVLALAGGLLFGALLPAQAQYLDVLDLYHELQVAQPNGFPAYELDERDGAPVSAGPSLFGAEGRVSARIDEAQLHLRIYDEGKAGDDFVTEVAVWLDREGAPLLGLSERRLKEGVPTGGRVRFYSRASGRWNLVTAEVLPSPEANVCEAAETPVDESTAGFAGLGPAVVLLPRDGVDLEVWCLSPSAAAGTGREMIWKSALGRFERGPRLAGAPPWPDVPGPGER